VSARGGADLVLAARVIHHAPRPAEAVKHLAHLARAGGAVAVIDYVHHEDEAMRDAVADLWLGFEPDELARFAKSAGLEDVRVVRVPPAWCGTGPDRHVPWQVMVARKPRAHPNDGSIGSNGSSQARRRRTAGA
jgi:ArsR family transcriptional regulator